MTTPTAVTIFRWLYLSVSDWQPILENRSDPLQHSERSGKARTTCDFFSFYNYILQLHFDDSCIQQLLDAP